MEFETFLNDLTSSPNVAMQVTGGITFSPIFTADEQDELLSSWGGTKVLQESGPEDGTTFSLAWELFGETRESFRTLLNTLEPLAQLGITLALKTAPPGFPGTFIYSTGAELQFCGGAMVPTKMFRSLMDMASSHPDYSEMAEEFPMEVVALGLYW